MNKFLVTIVICLTFITLKNTDVFAGTSDLVPPNNVSSTYDSYVIIRKGNDYKCIIYNSTTSTCHGGGSGIVVIRAKSGVESPYACYISTVAISDYNNTNQNGGWGTMSNIAHNVNTGYDTILYSNQDIMKTDNSGVFFPKTPPLKLEVEKALVGMEKKMTKDLLTLVGCGIACLVSLVGLALLGKKSLIFLH